MNKKLKLGLVGLRRGLVLAEAARLNPGATVSAVCDRNVERAASAAERFSADSFTEYEDMLESGIDAVMIASPPVSHAELSIAAVQKGISVLCEVPAVASIEEASRLLAAVRQSSAVYMMAENVCYFESIETMHRIV